MVGKTGYGDGTTQAPHRAKNVAGLAERRPRLQQPAKGVESDTNRRQAAGIGRQTPRPLRGRSRVVPEERQPLRADHVENLRAITHRLKSTRNVGRRPCRCEGRAR